MSLKKIYLVSIIWLFINHFVSAQIVQWRGPNRDGHYPSKGLLQEWPEGGPELIAKFKNLNNGYSSPVWYKETIYVPGKKDENTVLTAMKMDGTILWETPYGKAWDQSFPETRNTPTIEDDRVYITAGLGQVSCLDAISGELNWQVNTHEEFEAEFHRWGFAESLVLTDDAVISSPVGKQTVLVALDKETGKFIWKTKSLSDKRSYVSPLFIEYNGRKMIIAVTASFVIGVDPENGEIIWKYDLVANHPESHNNNTNTPLFYNGGIFVTRGHDAIAIMLELSEDGNSVSLKWTSDVLDVHHGGAVVVDGFIYGSNWINNGNGNWVCLDWDTGEVMYDEKWHNKGSIIFADNRLYVYEEKMGHVGLVVPNPSGFDVKGSFRVTEGTGPHWAHPAIFEKTLFVRHGDVLLVYDIEASN